MATSKPVRRGVYLLPALFTVGNLLCGFLCVLAASRGRFEFAAQLIVLAGILDAFDGRIARMTGATSEMGVQLDSLADMVSFGLAPAALGYFWALEPFRRTGALVAFLLVVCAATRLARFNVQSASADKRWFVGLPSPAAAGVVATIVYAVQEPPAERWAAVLFGAAFCTAALLMVSRLRYRAFKELNLRDRRSSAWVLVIAAAVAGILIEPRWSFLAVAGTYALTAPAVYLFGWLVRGRKPATGPVAAQEVPDGPHPH